MLKATSDTEEDVKDPRNQEKKLMLLRPMAIDDPEEGGGGNTPVQNHCPTIETAKRNRFQSREMGTKGKNRIVVKRHQLYNKELFKCFFYLMLPTCFVQISEFFFCRCCVCSIHSVRLRGWLKRV